MRPLLIILKTLIIGCLWSIVFIDGIRVFMLIHWHFDIFTPKHWQLLKMQWNSGRPITKSELGLLLIIFSSIPLWLCGWVGLCVTKWRVLLKKIFYTPLSLYHRLHRKSRTPVVIKKKSMVENAPVTNKVTVIKKPAAKKMPLPSATLMQSNINSNMNLTKSSSPSSLGSSYSTPSYPTTPRKKETEIPTTHALFNFDEDDFDLDFDFDKKDTSDNPEDNIPAALAVEKTHTEDRQEANNRPKNNNTNNQSTKSSGNGKKNESKKDNNNNKSHQAPAVQPMATNPNKESHTPVLDVITQKGYDIISSAMIKGVKIDYIGVSENQLLLCLIDKETGDWLADEEKFNDEEPLWFSESSHRISPVRQIDIAREIIKSKLAVVDMNFEIISYVIIQSGNIINAEDMFEIWDNMNINVTRINRGTPKEIKLFSKAIEPCEDRLGKNEIDKLKKLIYSMA